VGSWSNSRGSKNIQVKACSFCSSIQWL
jgi:hypothetical protein